MGALRRQRPDVAPLITHVAIDGKPATVRHGLRSDARMMCGHLPSEYFKCIRCEELVCWCGGHCGDIDCDLCDECCSALGFPCREDSEK